MNYIYSYIRDKKRNKRGIVVALEHQGEIRIGYSLLHKVDQWDRDLGLKIALSRAIAGKTAINKTARKRVEFIIDSASRRKAFEGLPIPSINSFEFFGPPKEPKSKEVLVDLFKEVLGDWNNFKPETTPTTIPEMKELLSEKKN